LSPSERANGLLNDLGRHMAPTPAKSTEGPIYFGVDVGTANVVSVAVDAEGIPLAGEITRARVVKEGMVIDYLGAIDIVRRQLQSLGERLGRKPQRGASAIPPGTESGNTRVTRYILEAADLEVSGVIDEPTAASLVLGIEEGVVVDVGGGTTGISIIEDGEVVYIADEPTGGLHLDLVIAGSLGISTEEAEAMKLDPEQQEMLFPVVRPVFEKIAAIVSRHLGNHPAADLYLVGGTCNYPGLEKVVREQTGLRVYVPALPHLVTPLGIALSCQRSEMNGER
jgi:ethanolamine utilization protein EutJ